MKALVTILLLVLVFSVSGQTIYTVNNNPGAILGVNVFDNWTDAQTAATDGDIIYIVPSPISYGTLSISKELTIYGIGLYPETQTNIRSMVDNVGINASNVRISGLVMLRPNGVGNSVFINQNITNITIEKCSFKKLDANDTGIANILIQNCVITENTAHSADGLIRFHNSTPNIRIANNIIYANQHSTQAYAVFYLLNGAIIENNLFMGHVSGARPRVFGSVTNSLIKNNIFYGASPNPRGAFTGNTIDHNMTFGSTTNGFTTTGNTYGSNNQIGVDPMFTNVQNDDFWSKNYDYSLMVGSTAIGAGDDGTDLGIDGGFAQFDPTATSLPLILSINIPAMISQGSQLPVTIKARGN